MMAKFLARWLRRIAQRLDARPITIEMVQVEPANRTVGDQYGIPVYWWRVSRNLIGVYPAPGDNIRMFTSWPCDKADAKAGK